VIRNVVIHLLSEQPLLADLYDMPAPADVVLRCTNLRTLDGKRPVFVDRSESVFYFPYLHVRFVEIPPTSVTMGTDGEAGVLAALPPGGDTSNGHDDLDLEIEIDEDFLRRVREA
jgi:hypothetical protein